MTPFERLRYRWLSLTRGMAQLGAIKDEALRQLLGHTRVIGWEEGLPVRSLTIPAEYGRASVAMAARLYNSIRPGTQFPGVMSLSVTNRCDCGCPHCFAANQSGEDLTADVWRRIIGQGLDMGAFSIVINGGEPLLREDLPDLIRCVDRDRATCLVYSNGSRLAERVRELHQAGLRRVAVALDFAEERLHDEHRKHAGLFGKALEGCRAAGEAGMLVGISTFSSPERLADGTMASIFELAARLGANEIIVYDLKAAGRCTTSEAVRGDDREYRRRFETFVRQWWEKAGAPGVWWYDHVTASSNLGCPGGNTMLNVSHCGEVRPCDFCRIGVGSVLEHDLDDLWRRLNALSRRHREDVGGCMVPLQNTNESEE